MKRSLNHTFVYFQFIVLGFLFSSCNEQAKEKTWQSEWQQKLPLLGHRNWVLVVDKAFPWQSAQGMTVINTGEPLPVVLDEVLANISKSTHVKPIVFTDLELNYLTEDLSPGVDSLRKSYLHSLKGYPLKSLLHNDVFAKLDSASRLFNVVVLKTESTIPYSSVFIQLDCAYWDGSREQRLRQKMRK